MTGLISFIFAVVAFALLHAISKIIITSPKEKTRRKNNSVNNISFTQKHWDNWKLDDLFDDE